MDDVSGGCSGLGLKMIIIKSDLGFRGKAAGDGGSLPYGK